VPILQQNEVLAFLIMVLPIILLTVYAAGYALSFCMLRTEHIAEGRIYTKGDRLATIMFSFLSWLMFLFIVISAWFQKIKAYGYWEDPVKPVKPVDK